MGVSRRLFLLCPVSVLAGCQLRPAPGQPVQARDFEIESIAKTDGDMVAEINIRLSLEYLRELARKLYVRNPNQLLRGWYKTRQASLGALFGPHRPARYPGLYGRRSAAAINLAFDENFPGDRVAAFVEGMRTMLMDAYGGKQRFYMIDTIDPQKLHYLARNFEIAFWKLGHDREPDGRPYLLSNSLMASGNLSFERLAGKLIVLQDQMAQVVADATNRRIKNVIQSVASTVFFPI